MEQSDAILYIGGPPSPNKSCQNNHQFGQVLDEITSNKSQLRLESEDSKIHQGDCDCRQWAFQFLRPRIIAPTPTRPQVFYSSEDTTTYDAVNSVV